MNCTKCKYPIFEDQLYEIVNGDKRAHFQKCPVVLKETYNVESGSMSWRAFDTGLTKTEAEQTLKRRRKQHPKQNFRIVLG